MILIGERIHGLFQDVQQAIEKRDTAVIQDLARRQKAAGAHYLDLNVGTAAEDPAEAMRWLVTTVQAAVDTPLAIDSQRLSVIRAGLEVAAAPVLINSAQGGPDQLDEFMPLALEHRAALVCLTSDANGMPGDVAQRLQLCASIVGKAIEHGMPVDHVFIDPVLLPISPVQEQLGPILEVLGHVKMLSDPAPRTIIGLSNVSQGASRRSLINRTALAMLMAAGLDAAIVDIFDRRLIATAHTADMLLNRRDYVDYARREKRE